MIPVLGQNSDFTAAPSARLLERFRDSKQPAYSTFEVEATQAVWAERNTQPQRAPERPSYSDGQQDPQRYSTTESDRFRDQGRTFEEERIRTDARVRDEQRLRDQERARQDDRVRSEQRSRNDDRSRADEQPRTDDPVRTDDRARDDERVRDPDQSDNHQRADNEPRNEDGQRVNGRTGEGDQEVSEADESVQDAQDEKVEAAGEDEGQNEKSSQEQGKKADGAKAVEGDGEALAEKAQVVAQEPAGADFAMYALELAHIRDGTGKAGKAAATKGKTKGVEAVTAKVVDATKASGVKQALADDAVNGAKRVSAQNAAAADEHVEVTDANAQVVADTDFEGVQAGEAENTQADTQQVSKENIQSGAREKSRHDDPAAVVVRKLGQTDAERVVDASKTQVKQASSETSVKTAKVERTETEESGTARKQTERVGQQEKSATDVLGQLGFQRGTREAAKESANGAREHIQTESKTSHQAGIAQQATQRVDVRKRHQDVARVGDQRGVENAKSGQERTAVAAQDAGAKNVKQVGATDFVREARPVHKAENNLNDVENFDEKALEVVRAAKSAARELVENPKPEGNPEAWKPLVDLTAMLPELTRGREGFAPIREQGEVQQSGVQGKQQNMEQAAQFVDPSEVQKSVSAATGQRQERAELPTEVTASTVRTEVESVSGPARQMTGPSAVTPDFAARGSTQESQQVAKPNQAAVAQEAEPSALHELRLAALEDPSLRVEMTEQSARLVVSLGEEGKVALHLRINDRVADVTVMGTARDLLTSEAPELATALAEQGLSLGNFQLGGQTQGEEQRESQAEMSDEDYEDMQVNGTSRSTASTAGVRRPSHNGLSVKA